MKEHDEEKLYTYRELSTADILREAVAEYGIQKKQGEFTVEDLEAFPEDVRMELIDGVIYAMNTPSTIHQIWVGEISAFFHQYIRSKKGKCITAASPISVQLDRDDKTMVQPDVLIVCDRDKFVKRVVYGAPDLVVEILSPSTRKKDITVKTRKYRNAGVKEYWMIDPQNKTVQVYEFEKSDFPVTYTFENKVPVGIFGGECEVDMGEIYGYMEFLYEDTRENL